MVNPASLRYAETSGRQRSHLFISAQRSEAGLRVYAFLVRCLEGFGVNMTLGRRQMRSEGKKEHGRKHIRPMAPAPQKGKILFDSPP
ncbi:MAG: hypothetical protein HZA50_03835 [Planctomycetes bacterium]|nr:hypothetical protein [Planctomycetota bacterium]